MILTLALPEYHQKTQAHVVSSAYITRVNDSQNKKNMPNYDSCGIGCNTIDVVE